jgi:DUF4097 and DUF4098 domain-containing protein YvlB
VRLGTVEDNATVKNGNGPCDIGSVHGDLRIRGGNGGIVVESAGGNVEAKTANGSLRVGGLVLGEAHLDTAMGDVEVGVGADTRVWLDVKTGFGRVTNALAPTGPPAAAGETVRISAHTSFGDIRVTRDAEAASEPAT